MPPSAYRLWLPLVLSVFVMALSAGAGIYLLLSTGGDEPDVTAPISSGELGLQLSASDENSQGIAPEAHFILRSARELSPSEVKAGLLFQPPLEFDIQSVSPAEHHLVPRAPLETNRVYHVSYRRPQSGGIETSWAFQVRSPLHIVATLPADESFNVPIDAGIEVTFSHDGVERPEDYVEISPRPEGHFEQHKRTLVFVPRELQPATIYTVRVKPGVHVPGSDLRLDEELVFQFETGTARRGAGPSRPEFGDRLDFLHRVAEAGTREAPLVSIVAPSPPESLSVEVFAYPSLDAFVEDLQQRESVPVWAPLSRARALVDPARLQPVLSFEAPVEGISPGRVGFIGQPRYYFRLPGTLPAGFYLLQTTYRGEPVQAWLQITDIATYVAVSQTSTLVWVNDVTTGQAISGATVEALGQAQLGRTDQQGISSFDTPDYLTKISSPEEYSPRRFALSFLRIADAAGRVAIVPLSPVLPPSLMSGRCGAFVDFGFGGNADYWTFTSTDRPVYQPSDTVRFWGVARHRDRAPGEELTLKVTGFPEGGGQSQAIGGARTLRTSDLGTFDGEVELEGALPGYYTVTLYAGDESVTGVSFRVAEYVKPAYRISLKPSSAAVFAGESVRVDVQASFFDGTPLPGLELRYGVKGGNATLVTDAEGRASFSITPANQFEDVFVAPVHPEEGEIGARAGVAVFPAELTLQAQARYRDGTVSVQGDVLRIDPARYEPLELGWDPFLTRQQSPAHIAGSVAGRGVSISVTEVYNEARETGERYDFINKTTVKTYQYDRRERLLTSASVTSDAQGRFVFSFPGQPETSYRIDLSVTDDAGRMATSTVYAYGQTFVPFETGGAAYITLDDLPESVFFSRREFRPGQEVRATMMRSAAPLPAGGQNRFLFYEGQRGIRHYVVQDNPSYVTEFGDRHIPSATIGGVYFNGFTYIEAQYGPTIVFNPESRKLNVEIKPGKASYEPGDEVTVDVFVTDATGRPVSAEVNVAAVDEALFAVQDFYAYQTSILGQLYRQVPSGIIRTYASHQYPPQLIEPGGRGGDGGVRSEFVDTAYFGTLRTGNDGRGSFSFKTPDNLTSWRVTAYAITAHLYAGLGSGQVVVSLPFFLDLSLNADYLAGETAVASVRAFGTALRGDEQVEFILKAPSLGEEDGVKASGRAFERVDIALPRLRLGEHEVVVEAKVAGRSDAVAHTINVVESRLVAPRTQFYDRLTGGVRLSGADEGPTTVVFSDRGKGKLYPLLQKLRFSYGDRVDQLLARSLASELLARHFGEEPAPVDIQASNYLQADRSSSGPPGVAILPFASPDLGVTAWSAALAPYLFGRNALLNALRDVALDPDETPERTATALFGLAALDEPVLIDVRRLSSNPGLGWRGRLYVGLALQGSGDHAGALSVLEALLDDSGEELGAYLRLRIGEDNDDILEATALAAVLAEGVGDARSEALLRYVQDNRSVDILLNLYEVAYARNALERLGAARAVFTYNVDGQRQEVTLERGLTHAVSVSPQQLGGLRVDVIEGSVAAVTSYPAPLDEHPDLQLSPDVSISRSVRVAGQETSRVPRDGLVEVTLSFRFGPQAPDGCYQITDYLPSGLKAVTHASTLAAARGAYVPPGVRSSVILPYANQGGKVSFCAHKDGPSELRYFARPSAKGQFVWEPATIHNQRLPAVFNLSGRSSITVE